LGAVGWVSRRAAAVLPSLALLALSACSQGKSYPGRETYQSGLCPQCHGVDRAGTAMGPPLKQLRRSWHPDSLGAYLQKPDAFVERNPRLQGLATKYTMVMPRFNMDESTRHDLVRYLLETEQ